MIKGVLCDASNFDADVRIGIESKIDATIDSIRLL
jgi:hypothetical protein